MKTLHITIIVVLAIGISTGTVYATTDYYANLQSALNERDRFASDEVYRNSIYQQYADHFDGLTTDEAKKAAYTELALEYKEGILDFVAYENRHLYIETEIEKMLGLPLLSHSSFSDVSYLEKLKEKLEAKNTKVDNKNEKIAKLKNTIAEQKETIEKLEKKVDRKNNKINNMKAQMSEIESKNQTVQIPTKWIPPNPDEKCVPYGDKFTGGARDWGMICYSYYDSGKTKSKSTYWGSHDPTQSPTITIVYYESGRWESVTKWTTGGTVYKQNTFYDQPGQATTECYYPYSGSCEPKKSHYDGPSNRYAWAMTMYDQHGKPTTHTTYFDDGSVRSHFCYDENEKQYFC